MDFDRLGFDRDVGLRLARARKGRGITQEELSKRIGLPRPTYANIESGRQRIPIDVVWRVAVVLGLPVDSLVPEPLNRKRPRIVSIAHSRKRATDMAAATNTVDDGLTDFSPAISFAGVGFPIAMHDEDEG
jgi:transcriptional regulator with XRE-family HTH domain